MKSPIQALAHCYDDMMDVLAVQRFKCSEVYRRSNPNFGLVIVYPASQLRCELAFYGDATTGQFYARENKQWPGRKPPFNWTVGMANIKPTTVSRIKNIALWSGDGFKGHTTVFSVMVIESLLKPLDSELQAAYYQAKWHIRESL